MGLKMLPEGCHWRNGFLCEGDKRVAGTKYICGICGTIRISDITSPMSNIEPKKAIPIAVQLLEHTYFYSTAEFKQ